VHLLLQGSVLAVYVDSAVTVHVFQFMSNGLACLGINFSACIYVHMQHNSMVSCVGGYGPPTTTQRNLKVFGYCCPRASAEQVLPSPCPTCAANLCCVSVVTVVVCSGSVPGGSQLPAQLASQRYHLVTMLQMYASLCLFLSCFRIMFQSSM
jgi:hypothetical protein